MTDPSARTADVAHGPLVFADFVGPELVSRGTDDASPTSSAVPVVGQHTRPDSRQVENALSTIVVPRPVGPT